jgi:DNA-binding GntR family transcriptional regulator
MTTSAESAYIKVKAAILDGRYSGGMRLPEDMIAGELGFSRTPVRDALRRLSSEGLVEMAPNFGARVAEWSQVQLGEITTMRAMLEGYAAELAAPKISAEALGELTRHNAAMEAAIGIDAHPDLDGVSKANLAFHKTIVMAADNKVLMQAIEPLWHFPMVIRKYALFSRQRLELSRQHHKELIAALTGGDPYWAREAMRMHIYAARAFDEMLGAHQSDEAAAE